MNKFWAIFAIQIFSLLSGCQQLQPDQVLIPEYPDLENVFRSQVKLLATKSLEKTVSLDGSSETNTLRLDSVGWANELAFFKEINPNQPGYVGVFQKESNKDQLTLTLNPEEKGILMQLKLDGVEGAYRRIDAVIHEDKDVYVHHREITVFFEQNQIRRYSISGYQKLLFNDTTRFSIEGILTD